MEPSRDRPSAVITFFAGVLTFVFLAWLCALVTYVTLQGIPEDQRAELVGTLTLAAVGLVLSAVVAARSTTTNPLQFIGEFIAAVRSTWKR